MFFTYTNIVPYIRWPNFFAFSVPSGAPSNVVALTIAPTSVNVSWDQLPTTARNGIVITYEVKYSWPLGSGQLGTMYVNTSGTPNQLVLNNLQECVQYTISVRAYTSQGPGPFSGDILDSSLNKHAQVPQLPDVLPNALTATSANLTWSCPLEKNYTVISYSVNVTANNPSSVDADCVYGLHLSYYFTVPGYQRYLCLMSMSLIPFTSYSFEVLVNTSDGEGELSMPRLFTTLQAPPTSPLNISASVLSYSSLLLTWSPPTCSNGIVSGYMVTYSPSSGFPSSPCNVSNVTTLLLQNLFNNTQYSIFVCALTMGGYGPNISVSATTPRAPSTDPRIVYLRLSTPINIENHQNDAALSQLQDEIAKVANISLLAVGINGAFTLESLCTSVQRCDNDVAAGTYRAECKIKIFLVLTSTDIAAFVQYIGSLNTSISIMLDGNTQTGEFCSCDLNVKIKGGTYSWPEAVIGQTVSQMCQYGVFGQNVTRYCSGPTWIEDASVCPTVVTKEFSILDSTIQNQTINAENVVNVSTQLKTVVSRATEVVDQSASNLAVVTTVITQISNISSPNAPVSNDDISSRVNPQPQSEAVNRALETITYIGVSLSLLGLAATIATLTLIRSQRQKDVSKFHIQLCCALFGMLLIFVTGIDRTEHLGGCVSVSVLIHYFTLVAVMWMGAEALLMFQKIVIVFVQITTRFIVVLSLICWVIPLIPVLIPLAIDRDLLVKRTSPDGYCFISNVTVFFAAFLGPILLILAFNAVIFTVVIAVIIKHTIKRSIDHNRKADSIQLMINIISVFVLFGLTWIFGALTIMKAAPIFQIVFTILNSFQGFLIFILFCVLKKEIRSSWADILIKCGVIRIKKSGPIQQSTKMSLITRPSVTSNIGKDETTFTEEMKTLGRTAQFTRTLSLHKRHMEEMITVTFDDEMETSDAVKLTLSDTTKP
eukprot:Em0011g451a